MTSPVPDTLIRANDGNYFGAVRRRISVRGLHLTETRYDAHVRIPPHQHESPSFFMPLGGRFIEGCDTVIRHYQGGEVGFHPPYESHWLTTPTHSARGFAIEIGAEWNQTSEHIPRWERIPRDLSRTTIAWSIARLYQELHMGDTASPLVIETFGTDIYARLVHITRISAARRPRWLNQVTDLLHDTVTQVTDSTPTLVQLASLAQVTPVALIRTFARHHGCTPGVYLRNLRLTKARQILVDTQYPIARVALDAGFYDQSHFIRAFKIVTGMTPSAYRQLLQDRCTVSVAARILG